MASQPRPLNRESRHSVLESYGYKLGNVIGYGTFAKVKLACAEETKTTVAIKIITKSRAPRQYITKFLPRELDIIRGLRHENLIRIYQSIETTHRAYIIMEYAENGSLVDLIQRSGYLQEDLARKYFRQLVDAIEYCHSQGVVHRDIKCENLLLDKNFNLKVIDFGFARKNMKPINNRPIMAETYCGSCAYASPEILKGVPYDPRLSDTWAIGVVLYAMVYGKLPFDGKNYAALMKQVNGKLVFQSEPILTMSCKNLLQRILCPLKNRLTLRQIMLDTWYQQPIQNNAISSTRRVSVPAARKSERRSQSIDEARALSDENLTKPKRRTTLSMSVMIPMAKVAGNDDSNSTRIDNEEKQLPITDEKQLGNRIIEQNENISFQIPLEKEQTDNGEPKSQPTTVVVQHIVTEEEKNVDANDEIVLLEENHENNTATAS